MTRALRFLIAWLVCVAINVAQPATIMVRGPVRSAAGASSSLLTGLVAFWPLDEASGARADVIGGNNLTDNNTVGSTTGPGGTGTAALFVAANSEYLSHASNAALQAGDINFTWTFFVKINSDVSSELITKDVDSPANSRDYTIDYVTGGTLRFYYNGGTALVQSNGVSTGTWYFVTVYHDADNDITSLQIDDSGAFTAQTFGEAPQVSSAEFRMGARAYAGFEGYADASLAKVAFFKRLITTGERNTLKAGGVPPF